MIEQPVHVSSVVSAKERSDTSKEQPVSLLSCPVA